MSFELAIPFLLPADVPPGRGDTKLTTATEFSHCQLKG